MVVPVVTQQQSLEGLSAEQLRELTSRLLMEVRHKQALIDKLAHELLGDWHFYFDAKCSSYFCEIP